jgi:hypothetical protein
MDVLGGREAVGQDTKIDLQLLAVSVLGHS